MISDVGLIGHPSSMLWSIDTCQNKVSADQYHVTILRAHVECSSRSAVFFKLTADQVLVSNWIAGFHFMKYTSLQVFTVDATRV